MACFKSPSRKEETIINGRRERVPSPGTYKIKYDLTRKSTKNVTMRREPQKAKFYKRRAFTDLNHNFFRYYKPKDKVLEFSKMPKQ